jgi:hypothetical protein
MSTNLTNTTTITITTIGALPTILDAPDFLTTSAHDALIAVTMALRNLPQQTKRPGYQ